MDSMALSPARTKKRTAPPRFAAGRYPERTMSISLGGLLGLDELLRDLDGLGLGCPQRTLISSMLSRIRPSALDSSRRRVSSRSLRRALVVGHLLDERRALLLEVGALELDDDVEQLVSKAELRDGL